MVDCAKVKKVINTAGSPAVITQGSIRAIPLKFGHQTKGIDGLAGVFNNAVSRFNHKSNYLILDVSNELVHEMDTEGHLVSQHPLAAVQSGLIQDAVPMSVGGRELGHYGELKQDSKAKNDLVLPDALAKHKGKIYVFHEHTVLDNPFSDRLNARPQDTIRFDAVGALSEIEREQVLVKAGGTIADILPIFEKAAERTGHEFYKNSLDLLIKNTKGSGKPLTDIQFDILTDDTGATGRYIHSSQGQEMILLRDSPDGVSLHTLTHELTHAATINLLTVANKHGGKRGRGKTYKRTKASQAFIKEINHLFFLADNTIGLKDTYGVTNQAEFVAELFSNPHFRTELVNTLDLSVRKNTDSPTNLMDRLHDLVSGELFKRPPNADEHIDQQISLLFSDARDQEMWEERTFFNNADYTVYDKFNDIERMYESPNPSRYTFARKRSRFWSNMNMRFYNAQAPFENYLVDNTELTSADITDVAAHYDDVPTVDELPDELVTREDEEFDDIPAIQELHLSKERANVIANDLMLRLANPIKDQHKALNQLLKPNNYTSRQNISMASFHVTASHVPKAVEVARVKLNRDIERTNNMISAKKQTGEKVEDWLIERQTQLEQELKDFDALQTSKGLDIKWLSNDPNDDGFVLTPVDSRKGRQGGFTLAEAQEMQTRIVDALTAGVDVTQLRSNAAIMEKIAEQEGFSESQNTRVSDASQLPDDELLAAYQDVIKTELFNLRLSYANTFQDITTLLMQEGEYNPEIVDQWRNDYRNVINGVEFIDYIPFTGKNEHTGGNSEDADAFGYGAGMLDKGVNHKRLGRASAPDSALVALSTTIVDSSQRIATRRFRLLMLEHIRNGKIPGGQFYSNRQAQAAKYNNWTVPQPQDKNIRPVTVRVGEDEYQWFIDDAVAMQALRGDNLKPTGAVLDWFGEHLTRPLASLITQWTFFFAPKNHVNDLNERVQHISNRLVRKGQVVKRDDGQSIVVKDPQGEFIDQLAASGGKTGRGGTDTSMLQESFRLNVGRHAVKSLGSGIPKLLFKRIVLGEAHDVTDVNVDQYTKDMLELEQLGGLSTWTDFISKKTLNSSDAQLKEDAVNDSIDQNIADAFHDVFKHIHQLDDPSAKDWIKAMTTQGILGKGGVIRGNNKTKALIRLVRFWNQMWDVRASVAIYRGLLDLGVDKHTAAHRVLDVMNFNQKGTATRTLQNIYFFAVPTMASKVNVWRDLNNLSIRNFSGRRNRQAVASLAVLFAKAGMLYAAASLLADLFDDEDDDEPWKEGTNRLDRLPLTKKENTIPLFIGKDEDDYIRLPVSFGMNRVVWRITDAIGSGWTPFGNDPTNVSAELSGHSASLLRTAVVELNPIPSSGTLVDPASDTALVFIDSIIPNLLKPIAHTTFSIDAFGRSYGDTFKRGVADRESGTINTPEFYKEVTNHAHDVFGLDIHPKTLETLAFGYGFGALSAVINEVADTGDDRKAKGREANIKQSLGGLNFMGASQFWGKDTYPSERFWYASGNKLRAERDKYQISVKGFKTKKDGTPYKNSSNIWKDRKDVAPRELHNFKQRLALFESYDKEITKLKKNLKNEWVRIVRKAANTSDDPERNYLTEVELLRQNEDIMRTHTQVLFDKMDEYLNDQRRLRR